MTNPAPIAAPTQRLLSIDVLRGLTIAFMIMVNNNGGDGAWAQMHHAARIGFTATDLVFPTFLFTAGASIVFAFAAREKRGASRSQIAWHTTRRAAILFALGIVVNGFPFFHLDHLRIYGVLQRIAVCYLAVALFYLWDRRVWTKFAALAAVLLTYWVLMQWVPVPGAGMPGRDIPFLDKDQNLVAWLDRQLMPGHLYEERPNHDTRDPEGLLSDLPAMGTALLGLLAGIWLRSARTPRHKSLGLAAFAASCLATGYLWSLWFPLNKKLWTSSYVLVAAGWSLAILAFVYWALDDRAWGRAGFSKRLIWPWLVFGSNAIAAYMISELLPGIIENLPFSTAGHKTDALAWAHNNVMGLIPDPGWEAFAYSVTFAAICFVPVWILYRKKIFIKV